MKISKVHAELTGNDVLSIINEFVKVEGLKINEANIIGNEVTIKGCFKKGVSFEFEAAIVLEGVIDNKIHARFSKFKLLNLGFFRIVRSFAIKKAVKVMNIKGFEVEKDRLIIDLHKVLIDIPYIELKPTNLYIRNGSIIAEVEEIQISVLGGLDKEKEKETEEKRDIKNEIKYPINKIKDSYSRGRDKIEGKIPKDLKTASDYIFLIPDIAALIFRLLKDDRVSLKMKMYLSASVAYISCPIDLIPDNIPLIGKIDDIGVAVFILHKIINDIPIQIIAENWEGKIDLISSIQYLIDYLMKFTNARNVEKLYNILEDLSTL